MEELGVFSASDSAEEMRVTKDREKANTHSPGILKVICKVR